MCLCGVFTRSMGFRIKDTWWFWWQVDSETPWRCTRRSLRPRSHTWFQSTSLESQSREWSTGGVNCNRSCDCLGFMKGNRTANVYNFIYGGGLKELKLWRIHFSLRKDKSIVSGSAWFSVTCLDRKHKDTGDVLFYKYWTCTDTECF